MSVPVLNDIVDDSTALVTPRLPFTLTLLLSHESHGQLANIDRVVRVLVIGAVLINQVEVQIVNATLVVLNRAETAAISRAVSVAVVGVPCALARLVGCDYVVMDACIGLLIISRRLSIDGTDGHLSLVSRIVCHVSILCVVVLVAVSSLEETLSRLIGLILSRVENSFVLASVGVGGARSRGSDASYMGRIRAFSFHRLGDGVVQVDDEILVDGILVRRFASLGGCRVGARVHTSSLSASLVVRGHSLRVLITSVVSVLDSRVIERIILTASIRNGRSDVVVYFTAMFNLLRVDRCRHI